MTSFWLVTGSTGQLALALKEELSTREFDFATLNSTELDVTNLQQTREVIQKLKPSVIVNTAAWTDVDAAETNIESAFRVNQKGVENLISAASITNSIFVQISTDYVFSGYTNKPWPEGSPMKPQTIYGKSKAAGENTVTSLYKDSSYIVRTAWLYSKYGNNFVRNMCKIATLTNDSVKVVNDQVGQPTYAKDLCQKIIELVGTRAEFGIYHGTNSGHASWFDFAREIFRLCGEDENRVSPTTSANFVRPAKRPSYSVLAHNSWNKANINSMRDWKIALRFAIPSIVDSIR